MAISFVGSAKDGKAGATSGTSTIPLSSGLAGGSRSSVQSGDIVIALFATGSAADRTLSITDGSSDYTLIGSELYANGSSYDANLRAAYKFMGSTPDASTTFGATGAITDAGAMAVFVFAGVDQTTPLDVTPTTATGTGTGRPNPPSITPSTSGAKVLVVGAGSAAVSDNLIDTNSLNGFISAKATDTISIAVGAGYKDWSSGAYDAAQFDGNVASAAAAWVALSIALRPKVSATISDSSHASTSTSPGLVAKSTVTPNSASHIGWSSDPGIGSKASIVPGSAIHAHAAPGPTLTFNASLNLAGSAHAHDAGLPAVVSRATVTVDGVFHAQDATSPTIVSVVSVTISAATHGHAAEAPLIGAAISVSPFGAAIDHMASQPSVAHSSFVTPSSSSHAHASAEPVVGFSVAIVPASAAHAHQASAPLVGGPVVSPNAAIHLHAAAEPVLAYEGMHGAVSPDSCVHTHGAGAPTIFIFLPTPPSRTIAAGGMPRIMHGNGSRLMVVPSLSRLLP